MPYKRKGSDIYYTKASVSPYGRIPYRSTGFKLRRKAQAAERALQKAARLRLEHIVRGAMEGTLPIPDVLAAAEQEALAELNEALDPGNWQARRVIPELAAFEKKHSDGRIRRGARLLMEYAPQLAQAARNRRGRTLDPTGEVPHDEVLLPQFVDRRFLIELLDMIREAEDMSEAALLRSVWRAIADFLEAQVGKAERNRLLTNVSRPKPAKARRVRKSEAEQRALIGQMEEVRFDVGLMALYTGADRKPILELRVRDWDHEAGTLAVPDQKTATRFRRLSVSAPVRRILARAAKGMKPEDRLFPLTKYQVCNRFRDQVREPLAKDDPSWSDFRFKDLRHLFAQNALESGTTIRDLQQIMGHADIKTTLGYLWIEPVGCAEGMEGAARFAPEGEEEADEDGGAAPDE